MKNIQRLVVTAIAMITIGFSDVNAQEQQQPNTVIVQVFGEMKGTDVAFSLLVTPPDGSNTYEVPMETRTLKNRKEVAINNTKIVQLEINKWKKEGFVIDGVSTIGGPDFLYIVLSK